MSEFAHNDDVIKASQAADQPTGCSTNGKES